MPSQLVEIAALTLVALLPGLRRLYRGRIFTRPIYRLIRRPRPPLIVGGCVRLMQLIVGDSLIAYAPYGHLLMSLHVWFIALYVDDWLTGGDDQWKRLKGWARNAVKWLMPLPPPIVDQAAS